MPKLSEPEALAASSAPRTTSACPLWAGPGDDCLKAFVDKIQPNVKRVAATSPACAVRAGQREAAGQHRRAGGRQAQRGVANRDGERERESADGALEQD